MDGQTCDVARVHVGVLFSHNCLLAKVAFDCCHVIEILLTNVFSVFMF